MCGKEEEMWGGRRRRRTMDGVVGVLFTLYLIPGI
jgi:hypothetical protein